MDPIAWTKWTCSCVVCLRILATETRASETLSTKWDTQHKVRQSAQSETISTNVCRLSLIKTKLFYLQAKSPTQLALWNIRTWPSQSVATANRRHRTRPIPQRLVTQCLSVRPTTHIPHHCCRSDALRHDRNIQKGAAVWRHLLDRAHCRIANCNGPRPIVCIWLHHSTP